MAILNLKTLLLLGVVSVNVFAIKAPTEGYRIEKSSRNIRLAPGDPSMTLNGPLEEVTYKANKLNPRWARDLEKRKPSETTSGSAAAQPTDVICNNGLGRWSLASAYYIKNSLSNLRQVTKKPQIGRGPGACSRLSCEGNSAIWWCNDSYEPRQQENYAGIIAAIEAILNKCTDSSSKPDLVLGQAFMLGNWNVIIRADKNYCTEPGGLEV
ncbi:hypothetical protein E4U13_004411 [Claviceps humidiphila]|uniref:Uncharacterized protein n=1 Tax=Claviceps humidiphila TaxID=1294629 RepID=A0A9P7PX35_9HYPO|nr:hypothetical protein E4U13_004411 [Claviceps humidiphila]